ncbi:response regulator transcription factor [Ralstonia flaminis]|jgi:two-component system capsular synthesis response regulator RcsB|uniref:Transcriptional regulatory protein RcsB n=1 Tax=Ralstonia flaminis TaxID=3058597 RepID=A0ABM9K004_9RALS|nr:response regulator transcription factor [Ralstonia sp. LMG 18101]CAJ0809782.1 Transcriptional regulatory protein RcsB [Ralstonia sp. LMG 18101]
MKDPVRLLLADDHPAIIAGVKFAVGNAEGIEIIGTSPSSTEMVAFLDRNPCDVLVTDYAMPGGNYGDGIPLLSFILRRYPGVRVLVLTMMDNPAVLSAIAATGVQGVLSKSDDLTHIVPAVHAAMLGQSYFSPTARTILDTSKETQGPGTQTLTRRESEVVRLFVSGLSVGEIAERLHRSKQTVSTQKNSAMRKLGLEREADLFRYAIETGLVSAATTTQPDAKI